MHDASMITKAVPMSAFRRSIQRLGPTTSSRPEAVETQSSPAPASHPTRRALAVVDTWMTAVVKTLARDRDRAAAGKPIATMPMSDEEATYEVETQNVTRATQFVVPIHLRAEIGSLVRLVERSFLEWAKSPRVVSVRTIDRHASEVAATYTRLRRRLGEASRRPV